MQVLSEPCPYCSGIGRVMSKLTMATKIERWFLRAKADRLYANFHLVVSPLLAEAMVDNGTDRVARLMKGHGFRINLIRDTTLPLQEYKVYNADSNEEITERYLV